MFTSVLTNIDPSGYTTIPARWFKHWKKTWTAKNFINTVRTFPSDVEDLLRESDALQVVAGVAACSYGGAAGCAVYNAYMAKIQGADDFHVIYAGAMGGMMAVSFTAVGDLGLGTATWQNALAHGAVGAFFAGMSGPGLVSREAAGFASGFVGEYYSNYGIGSAMLAGGIGSRISGGTFWSGARTASYGYIFNCMMHDCPTFDFMEKNPVAAANEEIQAINVSLEADHAQCIGGCVLDFVNPLPDTILEEGAGKAGKEIGGTVAGEFAKHAVSKYNKVKGALDVGVCLAGCNASRPQTIAPPGWSPPVQNDIYWEY
jgi:hypothetical protein